MTIVEFFDRDSIENIASSLLCRPDRVIFVGDDEKRMQKSIQNYKEVTRKRGLNIDFCYKVAARDSLSAIVSVLSEIAERSEDCHFDIEGGEDLYLVAVGIVSQKFGGRVGLHRFNIESDRLNDCDLDGRPQRTSKGQISVDENVKIYGGRVIYQGENPDGTVKREFTDEVCADIKSLWEVCRKNAGDWNFLVNDISKAAERQGLNFVYSKSVNYKDKTILKGLNSQGLIRSLRITPSEVTFVCKNELVKSCLLKAGLTLELFITIVCKEIVDDEGKPFYGDVQTGVFIDWDGKNSSGADVENEIDVFLMRTMIPVFISCKNGFVDSDELYKLSQVAERFGGKYAVKMLCITDLGKLGPSADSVRARARDMGIKIIENLDTISESALKNSLKI